MLLGAVMAGAVIVAMQVPLAHSAATVTDSIRPIDGAELATTLAWPTTGSAAVLIPALGVEVGWHQRVVPIASLTKLMTAYVTLHELPLVGDETGPCLIVTDDDLANYESLRETDQSSVAVAVGETLCESTLLEGLLVHSASNYADLLAVLVSGSVPAFVTLMNQAADRLDLVGTHYADASGYDSGSVSTALDQARLAALLMRSALVREIVDQPTVTLPVAGTVSTFTPFLGVDGVVGVKSGRTAEAGGCDVMAMEVTVGTATRLIYAVVLGQQGGNLLGPAGDAALALATSARGDVQTHHLAKGLVVATIGWGARRTRLALARGVTVTWWAGRGPLHLSLHVGPVTRSLRRGQRVGWLDVRGSRAMRIPVVADRAAAPPSLWQRLR